MYWFHQESIHEVVKSTLWTKLHMIRSNEQDLIGIAVQCIAQEMMMNFALLSSKERQQLAHDLLREMIELKAEERNRWFQENLKMYSERANAYYLHLQSKHIPCQLLKIKEPFTGIEFSFLSFINLDPNDYDCALHGIHPDPERGEAMIRISPLDDTGDFSETDKADLIYFLSDERASSRFKHLMTAILELNNLI